jgi:Ca-activated chloride channel family protein
MRAILAAGVAAVSLTAPAPQTFRSGVDAVRVDVLAMEGGRSIAGLTAADFELRDSGVVQRIDVAAFEDVPLSVMLVLDASASVRGQPLENLKQAASAVAGLLKAPDRSALLTFSAEIDLRSEWTGDRQQLERAIERTSASGTTGLHDAAYAALTLKDPQAGRPLVLVFSDGDDTASWLSGQTVLEIARRSDLVVYGVGLRTVANRKFGYLVDFHSGLQPEIPRVLPSELMGSFLTALSEETGGKYIEAERSDQLRETFVRIVTEFRSRYLLTYTPRGVDIGGWHPIEVKLKNRKGRVTARRGYVR